MTHDTRMTQKGKALIQKPQSAAITQAAAARIVGIARQNVLSAVARGDLRSVPNTDPVMIYRRSAERFAAKRAKAAQSQAS